MGVVNAFMGAGLLAFWSPKMGVQMTTALSSFFLRWQLATYPGSPISMVQWKLLMEEILQDPECINAL